LHFMVKCNVILISDVITSEVIVIIASWHGMLLSFTYLKFKQPTQDLQARILFGPARTIRTIILLTGHSTSVEIHN
jgi:hypothetical protein